MALAGVLQRRIISLLAHITSRDVDIAALPLHLRGALIIAWHLYYAISTPFILLFDATPCLPHAIYHAHLFLAIRPSYILHYCHDRRRYRQLRSKRFIFKRDIL